MAGDASGGAGSASGSANVKQLNAAWDPLQSSDWDKEKPTQICATRIQR